MKEKPFLYCKSQPLQTATAMNTLHYCIFYYFFIQPLYKYFRLTEKILVSQSLVFTIQHPSNCKLFKTYIFSIYLSAYGEARAIYCIVKKRIRISCTKGIQGRVSIDTFDWFLIDTQLTLDRHLINIHCQLSVSRLICIDCKLADC